MAEYTYAKDFRELVVYQRARKFAKLIYDVSLSFPKEEMFSLTDQIRRSSRSVGAQIAEAWAKRKYEKHFLSKPTDADGEQHETQHWIGIAYDCGYLSRDKALALKNECEEVGKLLGSMIAKAGEFCQTHSIRDNQESYQTEDLEI